MVAEQHKEKVCFPYSSAHDVLLCGKSMFKALSSYRKRQFVQVPLFFWGQFDLKEVQVSWKHVVESSLFVEPVATSAQNYMAVWSETTLSKMNQRNNFTDLDNQKRKGIVVVICFLYTKLFCTIKIHNIEFKSFHEPWNSIIQSTGASFYFIHNEMFTIWEYL